LGGVYTDKKEKKIYLIYKENQWSSCKFIYCMTNGLLKYGEIFAHFLLYKEALPHFLIHYTV
jgi:hypothetical protein